MKLAIIVAMVMVPAAAMAQAPGETPTETEVDGTCGRGHCGPGRDRWAVGLGHGRLEVDGEDGHQKSIFARVRLWRGLAIEAEMSRADVGETEARGGGLALVHSFGHRRLRPYVLAGGGGGVLRLPSGAEVHQRYAELGGGLMLRGRRLALALDLRAGVRRTTSDAADMAELRMPPPDDDEERDRVRRARLLFMAWF